MSYLDGKNVTGSMSPYTVWLRCGAGFVLGIDYQKLNKYIAVYNKKKLGRYVDFWPWYSEEVFDNPDYIHGFSALWNQDNANMRKVLAIGGHND